MAKKDILIDASLLHKQSESCDLSSDTLSLLVDLCESVPEQDLGLAAPQIGVYKRAFVARLSTGRYAFVNPHITVIGTERMPSTEGCLSVPGVTRCVERSSSVEITADEIKPWDIDRGQISLGEPLKGPLKLTQLDACIVQHENDHLNGILLTDLATTLTQEERVQQRQKDRALKVMQQRLARKAPTPPKKSVPEPPRSKAEFIKNKKKQRKQRQRQLKRVAIFEKFVASKSGLFDPQNPFEKSQNTDQGNPSPESNTSLA